MTMTPEKARELLEAATPGPWKWWTSNSWKRLKHDDIGITQSVLEPFVARDGHPDCSVSDEDAALLAAAPALARAYLAAVARVEEMEAWLSEMRSGPRSWVPDADPEVDHTLMERLLWEIVVAKARGTEPHRIEATVRLMVRHVSFGRLSVVRPPAPPKETADE